MSNPAASRPNAVNRSLTPKRRTRGVVENDQYAAFCRRILGAHARRVADGDVEGLATLVGLAAEVERTPSPAP